MQPPASDAPHGSGLAPPPPWKPPPESPPPSQPERSREPARAGPRRTRHLAAWLYWSLLLLIALLALATTLLAARQRPHPDMLRGVADWDVTRLDWWAYPLERHAAQRTVIGGTLLGARALPDGEHVWVVGAGGLILHSADGGRTWMQQHPAAGLSEAPAPTRSQAGWRRPLPGPVDWLPAAHAGSPPIAETQAPTTKELASDSKQDGAAPPSQAQAQPQPPPPSPRKRYPPAAPDFARLPAPATGPAASAPAAPIAPEPPLVDVQRANLLAVAFVDRLDGWAVGQDGAWLATRDGGATWAAQRRPTRSTLVAAGRQDALRGWLVSRSGELLQTRDGGATWQFTAMQGMPLPILAAARSHNGLLVWTLSP